VPGDEKGSSFQEDVNVVELDHGDNYGNNLLKNIELYP
jgi:hypothetical protein